MPVDAAQIVMVLVAAAGAGWVDAVVGGGGLVQLPALLLAGVSPVQALATNKLSSVFGTASAAVAYARTMRLDRGVAGAAGASAVVFAGLGAASSAAVPAQALLPVVMAALVVVGVVVAARPGFGTVVRPRPRTPGRLAAAVAVSGVVIAFYDGIVGPGTGTFLIIAFTSILGVDLLGASATAKIINTGTNVGALVFFAWHGHVLWALGLGMAVCNIAGAQLGARMALRRGARFVRVLLLVVVAVLVVRLGIDRLVT